MAEIEAGLYPLFRQKGMTLHELTPDQVSDWRACSASIVEECVQNDSEPARQLMAAYRRLRTEPCCSAGSRTSGIFRRW